MAKMLLKKIDIIAYIVSDWQRAKKFYGETLGVPVAAFINDEVGWMEFGEKEGTHLAISLWDRPESMPSRDGGGTAIFMVDDAYAIVNELRARGVNCEDVVAIPQMVTYANFYDPDCNRMQVAGPPPAEN
jgi:catechol 2,3-dioxygenase-like lactoylglutathione lyase family enzyme